MACTTTKNPPAPRLQLRWTPNDDGYEYEWRCHYELVLPLREHDLRREIYGDDGEQVGERSELVIPIKASLRGGGGQPCVNSETGALYFDTPFRDGAHAKWDSDALGGVPVYAIALDGTAILNDRKAEAA